MSSDAWRPTLPVFGLVLMGCSSPFASSNSGPGGDQGNPRADAPVIAPVKPLAAPETIAVTTLTPANPDPLAAAVAADVAIDPDLKPGLRSDRLNEWRRERADQCLAVTETPNSADEIKLAAVRHALIQAPLGRRLLGSLTANSTTICVPEAGDGEELFVRPDDSALAFALSHLEAVVMNRDLAMGRAVFVAAHEFRHSWQALQIPELNTATLSQPNDITASYIKEADANAFALAVAWQLREGGQADAWRAARHSSNYGDTAEQFAQAVRAHHRAHPQDSLTSDRAIQSGMRAAFEAWFDKPGLLTYYGDRALEFRDRFDHSWPGRNALPRNLTERLGQLPLSAGRVSESYLEPTDIGVAAVLGSHYHASHAPQRVVARTTQAGSPAVTTTRPAPH